MSYCYLNGTILPYKDCQVHVSDLQFQRGYGVFDFFRTRNGNIPWLDDYTDRLYNSMLLSKIEAPVSRADFYAIISNLQKQNGLEDGAFKVIISGGFSDNLESVTGPPNIIILNVPWTPPPQTNLEGVQLITERYTRPDPEIKTLFYFNLLKLHGRMREHSAVDVLYHEDLITETSRASIFFVKHGILYSPARNILRGITRKQILSIYGQIRLEDILIEELYQFDEIFITSTSRDVTPVVAIDGIKIGKGVPGNITLEIMDAYRKKLIC